MGLLRNLRTSQMVEQLVEARRVLAEAGVSIAATNIVFMGMGANSSCHLHFIFIAQAVARSHTANRLHGKIDLMLSFRQACPVWASCSSMSAAI